MAVTDSARTAAQTPRPLPGPLGFFWPPTGQEAPVRRDLRIFLGLVRSVLLAFVMVAAGAWIPGVTDRPLATTLFVAIAAAPLILAVGLAHRGRQVAARRIAVVDLTVAAMLTVASFGGLHGPVVYALPLSIAIVGLLRGRRAAAGATVVQLAFVGIEVTLESAGAAPFVTPLLGLPSSAVSVVAGLVMALGLIAAYTREVEQARREADESTRRALSSEQDLANLVRFSPDGVAVLNADGVIELVNEAMAAIAGRSAGELVGLGLPDLPGMSSPETREAVLEGIARLHERGESLWEMRLVGPGDLPVPVEVHARLIRNPDGGRKVQLVARDLSFRAEAEAARDHLEAQLREARRLEGLGRLAGGIAHDFRNLLTPITVNAGILGASHGLGPLERELAGEIGLAADRANELTQQLLAFARRQRVELRAVDLNAVVGDLEPILRRLLRSDVSLHVVAAGDLGTVRGDRVQLEQVLVNLIANARDAIQDGGAIKIRTENRTVTPSEAGQAPGRTAGRFVVLTVADTGSGMSEEVRGKIFEPFYTTKGPSQGTGLGLATVHGIVTQLGGAIEVESAVGRGTVFRILLPRMDAPVDRVAPAETPAPSGRGAARILVVDDDELVRAAVARTLRAAGHGVTEAADGAEALELSSRTPAPFDLVVTDLVMPRMAGRALATAIRARDARHPILFMSGYSRDSAALEADPAPGTAFLPKPFTRDLLLAKVSSLLSPAA